MPRSKFCDIIVNMDDSKALRDEAQIPREHPSPSQTANCPGSLLVNQLEAVSNATAVRGNKGRTAAWAVYFIEGWDDIGIWKSAVSVSTPRTSIEI